MSVTRAPLTSSPSPTIRPSMIASFRSGEYKIVPSTAPDADGAGWGAGFARVDDPDGSDASGSPRGNAGSTRGDRSTRGGSATGEGCVTVAAVSRAAGAGVPGTDAGTDGGAAAGLVSATSGGGVTFGGNFDPTSGGATTTAGVFCATLGGAVTTGGSAGPPSGDGAAGGAGAGLAARPRASSFVAGRGSGLDTIACHH
jgi:hypothetical protein